MKLQDLPLAEFSQCLAGRGVTLNTGAFHVHLRSDDPRLAQTLAQAYAAHEIETEAALYHVRVEIARGRWRGPGRDRGVVALINGEPILGPFPSYLAYPMLESILNWCIAKQVLRYVVFHAGAVERGGRALILSGPSGSGKSTLCAGLSQTGWRLLSDELILLRPAAPDSGGVVLLPNPRPISLKNEAIARIRDAAPGASFTEAYEGTIRGTIRFLHPLAEAVRQADTPAPPSRVVFPKFEAGTETKLVELERPQGFMRLVENSVNYSATLRAGFDAVADLAEASRFYDLSFGDLASAFQAIDSIAAAGPDDAAAA